MRTIKTLEELFEELENSGYFALRGATQQNIKDNLKVGDCLPNSFDTVFDENGDINRECEYVEGAPELNGTSGIGINKYMQDDKVLKMYEIAKGYADNHHETGIVYLIKGQREDYGDDEYEVIINNSVFEVVGAELVAIVKI